MSYPSIAQHHKRQGPDSSASQEGRLSGRQLDRATNGAPKVRVFFPSIKKTFQVVHTGVSDADKAMIEAFLTANQINSFTFTWQGDGQTYTCILSDAEPTFEPIAPGRWHIVVYLLQA